jgi:hypothetical protein
VAEANTAGTIARLASRLLVGAGLLAAVLACSLFDPAMGPDEEPFTATPAPAVEPTKRATRTPTRSPTPAPAVEATCGPLGPIPAGWEEYRDDSLGFSAIIPEGYVPDVKELGPKTAMSMVEFAPASYGLDDVTILIIVAPELASSDLAELADGWLEDTDSQLQVPTTLGQVACRPSASIAFVQDALEGGDKSQVFTTFVAAEDSVMILEVLGPEPEKDAVQRAYETFIEGFSTLPLLAERPGAAVAPADESAPTPGAAATAAPVPAATPAPDSAPQPTAPPPPASSGLVAAFLGDARATQGDLLEVKNWFDRLAGQEQIACSTVYGHGIFRSGRSSAANVPELAPIWAEYQAAIGNGQTCLDWLVAFCRAGGGNIDSQTFWDRRELSSSALSHCEHVVQALEAMP